jgi:ribulose-phosphate 3-epimerase
MKARLAPSILSADFANLESELSSIRAADLIHVDVMDGHFVPNLTIGLPVVRRLFEISTVPLDVHLMIEDPERWAGDYAQFAHSVTFHLEAASDPHKVLAAIKDSGAKVCVAIKPNTPVSSVVSLLPELDMILVMTVEPGFGGQGLIESTISKVEEAREAIKLANLNTSIQVDGGITAENIQRVAKAGADTFVAGTAVFGAPDRNAEIEKLRQLATTV